MALRPHGIEVGGSPTGSTYVDPRAVANIGPPTSGTPGATDDGGKPPPPPDGSPRPHLVQPKPSRPRLSGWRERDESPPEPPNPYHPTPAYRTPAFHAPTTAHPTALLTGHSHAKVVAEPTPSHAHLPLGSLSQTMKRFIELGTPHPTRQESTPRRNVWGARGPAPHPIEHGRAGRDPVTHFLGQVAHDVGKVGDRLIDPVPFLGKQFAKKQIPGYAGMEGAGAEAGAGVAGRIARGVGAGKRATQVGEKIGRVGGGAGQAYAADRGQHRSTSHTLVDTALGALDAVVHDLPGKPVRQASHALRPETSHSRAASVAVARVRSRAGWQIDIVVGVSRAEP